MTRGRLSQFGGFSSVVLLSAVAPAVFLPILARTVPVHDFVAVAVGQSIGQVAAVAINCGWSLVGPSRVAEAEPAARANIYFASLATRGVMAIPVLALTLAVVWLATDGPARWPAALTACVVSLGGLGADWFFIGQSDPKALAVLEVAPRLLFLSIGMSLSALASSVIFYPIVYLIGVLVALMLTASSIGLGSRGHDLDLRLELGNLKAPLLAEFSGASYSLGATAIVATTVPLSEAARFSATDRLYKVSLLAIIALSQTNQGWVAQDLHGRHDRLRTAMRAHILVGLFGCTVIALTLPFIVSLAFGPQFRPSDVTAVSLGVSFFAVSVSSALARYLLAPAGRSHVIVVSTVVAALAGLPSIVVMGNKWGAAGGAAGLAMSQLIVVLVQAGLRDWDRPTGASIDLA